MSHSAPISTQEVRHAAHLLRHNKALGASWLQAEFFQHHQHSGIYSALACLFNSVLQQGPPPSWNCLSVTSLHKKGDKLDPNNYRGILVMAVLPKLFATILNTRLEAEATEK